MEVGALRSGDPERLGRYALVGRVGEGGQGAVFLGADEDGREVAIKLLHSELTSDDKARARFLRELEVAKQVAPFCTAQVLDADVDGDRPYIVSEYVPGPSLNQQVTQDGPVRGAALDRLAVGTATALSAIHQAKIIHRDFKPHNVLIGPDGPRVIDFGVARAISGGTTLTSRVIGTPSYMAPEQISGDDVGTPADVFCWAATLVFAATGEPPFGQDTIPAVINRILHEEPDLGDMSGPLRDLVTDCLEKDPALRPAARQVLMRLLGHEEAPVEAAPIGNTDETAMLAAGSVLAAELAADEYGSGLPGDAAGEPAEYEPAAFAETDPADHDVPGGDPSGTAPARLPTPAEWAAENAADTLPRDRAGAAGGAGGAVAAMRRSLAGSSRSAVLAGAAALFVAIVVVSAVLVLGPDHKGKAGEKVGDPSHQPQPSGDVPSMTVPSRQAPTRQAPDTSYSPSPTTTGSAPESPLPTDTPTSTPTTPDDPAPTHTTHSPDPTTSPTTGPTDPGTPTDNPPGSPAAGTGTGTGTG